MRTTIKGDVKNIPARYMVIDNIEDYIDDLHSPRLSVTERENLDIQLMQTRLAETIAEIRNTPGLSELVQASEPVQAVRVKTRTETYHVLRFANGNEVRCKPLQYKASPVKATINRLY